MRYEMTILVKCVVPGPLMGKLAEHTAWDDHPWTAEEVAAFVVRFEPDGEWVYHSHRYEPII